MRVVLAAVLLIGSGGAQGGALDDCRALARAAGELMPCLQAARRHATDRMLEAFLAIEQRLERRQPDAARARSLAVLKQSQRDFERYQHAHCQVAQHLALGAAAGPAASACEVDQIRARAAALEALAADTAD